MSETWRLLLTGPGEPGFNMALDEALAIAVRRGWSPPTLRIYQWQQPAISLGCHQPLSVLGRFGEEPGVPIGVVRRPTAGGAVHHAEDVSYALACDHRAMRGVRACWFYRQFHAALGKVMGGRGGRRYALSLSRARSLPEASRCFQSPIANDLMCGRTKIAGAAQRRWRDGFLQQGTVLEPRLSHDRIALCIRMAWANVLEHRFVVDRLTVQERVLTDELWSKYCPWTPSSWPPVFRNASNPSR